MKGKFNNFHGRDSGTENHVSSNLLLAENPDLIKMLDGYIAYSIKKKSLSTVFK